MRFYRRRTAFSPRSHRDLTSVSSCRSVRVRIVPCMQTTRKLTRWSPRRTARPAPLALPRAGRPRPSPAMFSRGATTSFLSASRVDPPLHCHERPVLLLHGFLATPLVLDTLAAALRRSGYCAHVVQLGGLFGRFNTLPIEHVARVVAERVEQLVQVHRCERIDVVGHSEGGLIGRYYVQRLDGAQRVRHLVTLGTPHRGTFWAYAGYLLGRVAPSLAQMVPGSPLLRALTDERFPPGVRLTSIYSRWDSICPPSSCRVDSHQRAHLTNVEVADVGHIELLLSARIASIVERQLEAAEPPRVGTPEFAGTASRRPPMTPTPRVASAARAA
jgi:palmitoyl protein thioesterase